LYAGKKPGCVVLCCPVVVASTGGAEEWDSLEAILTGVFDRGDDFQLKWGSRMKVVTYTSTGSVSVSKSYRNLMEIRRREN
jgi:hypothetical protein